ncbi:MAG TPA: caspase family protein [Spirochaetia bacterium]|nr:caspase family protein [Spirochaetales bacterium]HRY78791.1 caspase family protein [Spirochaetia bacterium]HRZ88360.1 caspase family protein [Spirochaetia bacterium]
MTRPKRSGKRLFQILLFTLTCPLFTLSSCSFEITATRYALVYGAQNYDNATDLNYTDDDAIFMKAALEAAGWSVIVIREPKVTRDQFLQDIMDLANNPDVQSDSSILVYFSGHGTFDSDGNTYICPTDTTFDGEGETEYSSCISSGEILSALQAFSCRNKVAILDTCYSGGLVSVTNTGTTDAADPDYTNGSSTSTLLATLKNYSTLFGDAFRTGSVSDPIVVTAAGSQEESLELSTYGHGVFTYFFLQAAEKGDLNGDGHVTIQEAFSYAKGKVETNFNTLGEIYPTYSGSEFLPRISGNARDIVIF